MDLLVFIFLSLILLGVAILSLIFAFQEGWFDEWETLQRLVNSVKLAINLVDNFLAVVKPNNMPTYSICNSQLSVTIKYTKSGHEKLLSIPYRPDLKGKMAQWKVLLVYNKNESINITQEMGFPYLCTPQELGGTEIIATNILTEEVIQFTQGMAPGYLGLDTTT